MSSTISSQCLCRISLSIDLDRVLNIKGLCPLCHRAIHHREDEGKSKIIEKLYKDSRDGLEAIGIQTTLSDFKKAYGIK